MSYSDPTNTFTDALYKYTLTFDIQTMTSTLEQIKSNAIARRLKSDRTKAEFPQFLAILENLGIAAEPGIQQNLTTLGFGDRWPEVQALGREMYEMKYMSQPQQIVLPTQPIPMMPSPMLNAQAAPLSSPTSLQPPNGGAGIVPGYTPMILTTMQNGQTMLSPMNGSHSPLPSPLPSPGMPSMSPLPIVGTTPAMWLDPNDALLPLELPQSQRSHSEPGPDGLTLTVQPGSKVPPVAWDQMQEDTTKEIIQDRSRSPSLEPVYTTVASPLANTSQTLITPYEIFRSTSRSPSPSADYDDGWNYSSNQLPAPYDRRQRSTSLPNKHKTSKAPTKKMLAEAKLKELNKLYGSVMNSSGTPKFSRTGMRGESVLRLKAKTKRALEHIVKFIKFLDSRVQLEEISCPRSTKPAKDHVRGFLAYIRTLTLEDAKRVHSELFEEYCSKNLVEGKPPFKNIELNPMARAQKEALLKAQEEARRLAEQGQGTKKQESQL